MRCGAGFQPAFCSDLRIPQVKHSVAQAPVFGRLESLPHTDESHGLELFGLRSLAPGMQTL